MSVLRRPVRRSLRERGRIWEERTTIRNICIGPLSSSRTDCLESTQTHTQVNLTIEVTLRSCHLTNKKAPNLLLLKQNE